MSQSPWVGRFNIAWIDAAKIPPPTQTIVAQCSPPDLQMAIDDPFR